MIKNFKFLNIFILLVLIILNSCSISDLPKKTTNKEVKNNSDFKVKNLTPQDDPSDNIELISKNMASAMTIEKKSLYPKNLPTNFKGLDITPSTLNIIEKKGFTQAEIDADRKAYWESWKTWYHSLYKMLRGKIIEAQRQEDELEKDKFEYNLKAYKKGSKEYKLYTENFKKDREARHKKYKEQRKELKQIYKTELERAKKEIFTVLPKNKGFNVKATNCSVFGWSFECDPLVQVALNIVKVTSPIVGIVSSVIDGIKNLITSKPQTPESVNTTTTSNTPVININPSQVADVTSQVITKVETSQNLPSPINDKVTDKTNEEYLKNLLNQITLPDPALDTEIKAIFATIKAKQILNAIGITENINLYSGCGGDVINTSVNIFNTAKDTGKLPDCDFALVNFIKGIKTDLYQTTASRSKEKFFVTFNFFGARAKTDEWLISLLNTYYYKQPESRVNNPEYDKAVALIRKYANTTIETSIEGPKLCEQISAIDTKADNVFSFELGVPTKSLLFDGLYKLKFKIKDSSNKDLVLIEQPLNIAKALGKEITNTSNDLSINELQYFKTDPDTGVVTAVNDINTDVGVYVKNLRGNLWNVKVEKVGDPDCAPIYNAECIDSASSVIKFNKNYLETGLYKISSYYSNPSNLQNLSTYKAYNSRTGLNNEYYFLVPHITYSTFSRVTDKPAYSTITSIFDPTKNATTLSSFKGISMYEELNSVGFIDNPSPLELYNPQSSTDNVLSKKIVKSMLTNLSNPNISTNFPQASKDLFIDLAKPHTDSANTEYDLFSNLNVKSCATDKFINVGAVIDITNKIFLNNNSALYLNREIPLILEIVDKTTNLPVKKWAVNAKIGEITVVQKYWDGTDDDSESVPNYKTGNYQVQIRINYDNYKSGYIPSSTSDPNSTYLSYPNIFNTSTNSQLSIVNDNSCPVEAVSPDDKLLLEYISKSIEEIEPVMLAVNTSEIASISTGFQTAATRTLEENKAELDKVFVSFTSAKTNVKRLTDKCLVGCNKIDKISLEAEIKNLEGLSSRTLQLIEEISVQTKFNNKPKSFLLMFESAIVLSSVAVTGGLQGSVWVALDQGGRTVKVQNGIKEITKEGIKVLQRSQESDCAENAKNNPTTQQNLSTIRQEIHNLINGRYINYREMIAAGKSIDANQSASFPGLLSSLEDEIYKVKYFQLPAKKQELDKMCEDCLKYGDENSEANLKCRICKLSPSDRNKFKKTVEIRRIFTDEKVDNIAVKTVAYGDVYGLTLNDYLGTVVSFSGKDSVSLNTENNIRTLVANKLGVSGSKIILGKEATTLSVNPPVFISQKTIRNDSVQNDAEIKILETVNKEFKERGYSKVNLTIFSDRVTCVYCQEVISQNRAALIKDSIINLGAVDGKPIYIGESIPEKSTNKKLTLIENILKQGCK